VFSRKYEKKEKQNDARVNVLESNSVEKMDLNGFIES
jgi:hypothetical protein